MPAMLAAASVACKITSCYQNVGQKYLHAEHVRYEWRHELRKAINDEHWSSCKLVHSQEHQRQRPSMAHLPWLVSCRSLNETSDIYRLRATQHDLP